MKIKGIALKWSMPNATGGVRPGSEAPDLTPHTYFILALYDIQCNLSVQVVNLYTSCVFARNFDGTTLALTRNFDWHRDLGLLDCNSVSKQ